MFQSNQTVIPALGALSGGIYLRDLETGRSTLVSRATGVDGAPDTDARSAVGGRLAGRALRGVPVVATDLAPGPPAPTPTGDRYVYLRDVRYGRTLLVSRADGLDGPAGGRRRRATPVTADGCRVAFDAQGNDVAAGSPGNGGTETYVRDLCHGTTTLVSRAAPRRRRRGGHAGAGPSRRRGVPQGMSADGRYVLFETRGDQPRRHGLTRRQPRGLRARPRRRPHDPGQPRRRPGRRPGRRQHRPLRQRGDDSGRPVRGLRVQGHQLDHRDTGGEAQVYRRELGAMPP